MKTTELMAAAALLCASLAPQAGAALIPIDETVRPVITQQVIGGVTVLVTTVTIEETDPDDPTKKIVKTQKEYTVPGEGGTSERILEETTITVTPSGVPGIMTVKTETVTTTTPIDSNGNAGTPTPVESGGTVNVDEDDLDLPESTMAEEDGAGAPPLNKPNPVSGQ